MWPKELLRSYVAGHAVSNVLQLHVFLQLQVNSMKSAVLESGNLPEHSHRLSGRSKMGPWKGLEMERKAPWCATGCRPSLVSAGAASPGKCPPGSNKQHLSEDAVLVG